MFARHAIEDQRRQFGLDGTSLPRPLSCFENEFRGQASPAAAPARPLDRLRARSPDTAARGHPGAAPARARPGEEAGAGRAPGAYGPGHGARGKARSAAGRGRRPAGGDARGAVLSRSARKHCRRGRFPGRARGPGRGSRRSGAGRAAGRHSRARTSPGPGWSALRRRSSRGRIGGCGSSVDVLRGRWPWLDKEMPIDTVYLISPLITVIIGCDNFACKWVRWAGSLLQLRDDRYAVPLPALSQKIRKTTPHNTRNWASGLIWRVLYSDPPSWL